MTDLMALDDPRAAFANQIAYCRANDAPLTARIVEAILANFEGPGEFLAKLRDWPGKPMADALPLRAAGALHGLYLSGAAPELEALYAGNAAALAEAEALIAAVIEGHDAALLPWLDGPPQTNEAGRSASYAAALAWLTAQGLPARFECVEIGSSAGINLLMNRYGYVLGGVTMGAYEPVITIEPDWRGPPPPDAIWRIESLRGCDVEPLDLSDARQLMRLKAYVWPEHRVRFARLERAAQAGREQAPDLVQADAVAFVTDALARPQAAGTTRILMHSIVWQYLGAERQDAITAAVEAAGAVATSERPLAWVALETNRVTFRHELTVRHWAVRAAGDGAPVMLAHAHAHGAWVEWLAPDLI